jgi:protein arginine N-methyltransferase 5
MIVPLSIWYLVLIISSALSLPKLLPPVSIQSRWYSEPVRLLTLDNKIFPKNAKGYPVLSRAHQALISRFIRLRTPPWFLLCDVGSVPTLNPTDPSGLATSSTTAFPTIAEAAENPQLKDPTPQLSYMRNLQTKQPVLTPLDRFGAGYQDYLQAPLQPLTVNLESITYEVFEKDPIKYAWYERAIARALHDWIEQGKPTSNPDGRVVVAVVGAGRGPLVTRALKASEDVGVEIDLWALEKNPNAFVLLQRHNETIWNNRVKLVKSDMRTWRGPLRPPSTKPTSRIYNTEQDDSEDQESPKDSDTAENSKGKDVTTFTGSPSLDSTYLLATSQPASAQPTPYKIDILISELLGSFADNELSPECLDGVQHLMNPVHGISIPASYTAHLTPIAAPKLYADITHGMTSTTPNAAEIPYVVMLNAIDYLSTTGGAEEGSSSSASASATAQALSPTSPNTSTPNPKDQSQGTGGLGGGASSPPISVPAPNPTTPQPIVGTTWSFQHPNPLLPSAASSSTSSSSTTSTTSPSPSSSEPISLSNAHNARSSILTFPIPNRGTCHGLAGYFETVLYKGVELSTNPITMDAKSEGMISWFPIYFPLKV